MFRHRFWLHFGTHLVSVLMFLRDRFVERIFYVFFIDFVQKRLPITKLNAPFVLPFSSFCRPCSVGCVFEASLAHFGSLLAPCWSFWVPLLIRFESFQQKNILTFVTRVRKAPAKQSHTPSSKESQPREGRDHQYG